MWRALTIHALLVAALGAGAAAQGTSAAAAPLSGTVRDVSGALMQAVTVRVFGSDDDTPAGESVTDAEGRFSIPLPPGEYRVEVSAPAFTTVRQTVTVPAREPLAVVLDLEPVELTVDVSADDELDAAATLSLTSTMLAGDELLNLPRTEEELIEHLLMLAGEDATGDLDEDLAGFVIDGFTDGRLPNADEIAQIIIDPNPMTADGTGRPRIEIVTRPGTGRWRRSLDVGFADESLNARTPGEARKEPRQTRDVEVDVEGPIVPGRLEMSFQLSTRTDERAGNSLRAITPSGQIFQGVVQPREEREFEVGAELQLNASHRLDVQVTGATERTANAGVGGFTLPERASDDRSTDWSLRISERLLGSDRTNNFRFQVTREHARELPRGDGFAIDVADAFEGGGGTQRGEDDELTVGIENTLRLERGPWNLQWGTELQYASRTSVDRDNFNGTFEFASLHDYCRATAFAGANCADTARLVNDALARGVTPAYVDARGREVEITGVPVTFTQAFGNAALEFSEVSFDTFVQADRRWGRRASLRLGARYDGTNHSRDFLRVSPTANLQYQLTSRTVVSGGARLAFQDFRDTERLRRNDGSTHETELFISAPSFPDPFLGGTVEVGEETASMWVLDPAWRSPYTISPQASITQQLAGRTRVTLSYALGYGYRQRRTRNINAPFPGTPLPETILDLPRAERQEMIDQMRPFYPHVGNITRIESTGRSVSRTLRLRVQPRGTLTLAGFGFSGSLNYTYRTAEDDNDFNNPYAPEWGLSRRDHSVQSQFRVRLPGAAPGVHPLARALARATYGGANLNFSIRANTGRLYSIQSGRDLNGDQSGRDRPPGVARNTEVGPGSWRVDVTLTKDYRLGADVEGGGDGSGAGGRGGRGFQRGGDTPRVRFQVRANNLLNRAQPRAYGSVLTSPLFGLPTGYTGGRTVTLSMNVAF